MYNFTILQSVKNEEPVQNKLLKTCKIYILLKVSSIHLLIFGVRGLPYLMLYHCCIF